MCKILFIIFLGGGLENHIVVYPETNWYMQKTLIPYYLVVFKTTIKF